MDKAIIYLVILGFLTSCVSADSQPTATAMPPSPWLVDFLNGAPCRPPCWKNITPGVTDYDQALEILTGFSDIRITSQIDLNFKAAELDLLPSGGTGKIDSDYDKKYVSDIVIRVDNSQRLWLGDVVSSYGPPELVEINYDGHNHCSVHFLYPQMATSFSLGQECKIERTTEEEKIIRILIHEKTSIDSLFMVSSNESKRIIPRQGLPTFKWMGFGEYVRAME